MKNKSDTAGGLAFVGAFLIGLGLGMYHQQTAVGTLIGLGAGFILFAIIKTISK